MLFSKYREVNNIAQFKDELSNADGKLKHLVIMNVFPHYEQLSQLFFAMLATRMAAYNDDVLCIVPRNIIVAKELSEVLDKILVIGELEVNEPYYLVVPFDSLKSSTDNELCRPIFAKECVGNDLEEKLISGLDLVTDCLNGNDKKITVVKMCKNGGKELIKKLADLFLEMFL